MIKTFQHHTLQYPKPGTKLRDRVKKEVIDQSTALIDIDAKILNKILVNPIQQYITMIIYFTKVQFIS